MKQEIPIPKRDLKYDGLRAIGLLAIILAHTGPPDIIYQLRNFDVPLMVLISGAVFGMSSGVDKNYWVYLWSRIRRLAVPTWIFLTIYFIYLLFIKIFFGARFPYSQLDIIKSYTLTWGVAYIWIIRIFILVAIIIPFFLKMFRKIKDGKKYLLLLAAIYIIYELINLYYSNTPFLKNNPYFNFIFQNYILNILPYGCIAGLGLYLAYARTKTILFMIGGFFILFISFSYFYNPIHFTPTQPYKYPPQIYYLSYALFVALSLYLYSKTKQFEKFSGNRLVLFIGRSSLWIYLWHILFLSMWGSLEIYLSKSIPKFIFLYFFVLTLAILATFLQQRIIKKIIAKYHTRLLLKKTLTESFLM